ncbi:gp53-like domain-containing protein, partial [Turicimonas sp. TL08]
MKTRDNSTGFTLQWGQSYQSGNKNPWLGFPRSFSACYSVQFSVNS